ncbi:MAG: hemolysin III family protein [Bacilli bacterium]
MPSNIQDNVQSQAIPKRIKRRQSIGEEIANAVSHCVMAIFGLVALILLLVKQDNGRELAAALIFGLSIFILYTMSTLYHSLSFTKAKGVFKRFDHLSIFILIGGTFAPALLLLPSLKAPFLGIAFIEKGLALLIIQWVVIALGIVFKSIWVYKFQAFHFVIYLILGWSALFFIGELYQDSVPAFWFILGGGLAYTIGTIFYALGSKVKYFHFIWHLWVNVGTILQFIAIYFFIMNLA